jgi:hypothetical protein
VEDYRDIPVEVLRDFARTRAEMTSIRKTCEDAGVSHSAFHKFIQGRTKPNPRVRRLLGLWYLENRHKSPHQTDIIRPYVAAVAILVSGIPAPEREAASTLLVHYLPYIYEGRAPLPDWLELLLKERSV